MKKILLIGTGGTIASQVTHDCIATELTTEQLLTRFRQLGIRDLYAYNASFDRNHLPEFSRLRWHDIMSLAAYRQHNRAIPRSAECCSTGRLKRGYGVEPMLRLLSGKTSYQETHNALDDALDELKVMKLLGRPCRDYIVLG